MGLAAPRHVVSYRTRARTCVSCIGRRTLNHCATREALGSLFFKWIVPGSCIKVDEQLELLSKDITYFRKI